MGQRRKKVRSRRGQPCRKKRLLRGKCRVPKGKSINEHGSNNAKSQVTQTKLPLTYSREGMSDYTVLFNSLMSFSVCLLKRTLIIYIYI